jgi:hypothetical protein
MYKKGCDRRLHAAEEHPDTIFIKPLIGFCFCIVVVIKDLALASLARSHRRKNGKEWQLYVHKR